MLVSAYNNRALTDVLVIMTAPGEGFETNFVREGQIAQIKRKDTHETIGYNIFQAESIVGPLKNGPVTLSKEQVSTLNQAIKDAGFSDELTADLTPKFVVGEVLTCDPVEDSDRLSVTQMDIGEKEPLQIVCGAANIAQGQKVVVAKPGAIMPDGLVIWPGQLRGVDSYGMICSAKELGLSKDEWTSGILVLSDAIPAGTDFFK